jgi:hypothetical protein
MATPSRCFENSYASGPYRQLSVPDRPAQWDMLLSTLQLTESQARLLLKIPGSKKAEQLRRWIERHHRDRFVPVRFLNREQMERCRWD